MAEGVLSSMAIAGRFYEAAAEPAKWPEVWADAVAAFGGCTATLLLQAAKAPRLLGATGYSAVALRLYEEYYHRCDLWAAIGRRQPKLAAALGEDLVSAETFARSEVWNDFSRPHVGAFHLLGSAMPVQGATIAIVGIHRPRDAPAFDESDRQRLGVILPHLQRALQLMERLATAESNAVIGFGALDALAAGIILTDAQGTVLFVNRSAEAMAAKALPGLLPARGSPLSGKPSMTPDVCARSWRPRRRATPGGRCGFRPKVTMSW